MKEMLSDFGRVEVEREVSSEVQTLDLIFSPTEDSPYNRSALGLLGRMIEHPCALEPFRNGVPEWEICNCRHKRFNLSCELHRLAKQKPNNQKSTPFNPFLWILTPTFSKALQREFKTELRSEWGPGIYFLPSPDHTAIVVIHQLPKTLETLWLRLLGRDRVQADAIAELLALPMDHPYRVETMHHILVLQKNLRVRQNRNTAINEVIMSLSTAYKKWYADTLEEGRQIGLKEGLLQIGLQEGVQQERRSIALKMIVAGSSAEFVAQVTGYSIQEIRAIIPSD